jgi:hypothetical protein
MATVAVRADVVVFGTAMTAKLSVALPVAVTESQEGAPLMDFQMQAGEQVTRTFAPPPAAGNTSADGLIVNVLQTVASSAFAWPANTQKQKISGSAWTTRGKHIEIRIPLPKRSGYRNRPLNFRKFGPDYW